MPSEKDDCDWVAEGVVVGDGASIGDHAVARWVRLLRNQGMERPYETRCTARRQANARVLDEALAGHPDITPPVVRDGPVHVYHRDTVRSPSPDALQLRLDGEGGESRVYYPTPVHRTARSPRPRPTSPRPSGRQPRC